MGVITPFILCIIGLVILYIYFVSPNWIPDFYAILFEKNVDDIIDKIGNSKSDVHREIEVNNGDIKEYFIYFDDAKVADPENVVEGLITNQEGIINNEDKYFDDGAGAGAGDDDDDANDGDNFFDAEEPDFDNILASFKGGKISNKIINKTINYLKRSLLKYQNI